MEKCFQCGRDPMPVDWGGCTEFYDVVYQMADITCSGSAEGCQVEVSISLDANKEFDTNNIEQRLSSMWDMLNKE